MAIAQWEIFLKTHIKGLFRGKLGHELVPAAVEKALKGELKSRRKRGFQGDIVPNSFVVTLNPRDYQRLSSRRFHEDLYVYMEKFLILADIYMDEQLQIQLRSETAVDPGRCRISSCFATAAGRETGMGAESGTLILKRRPFSVPLNLPPKRAIAVLTAVEGPDKNTTLAFGEHKIFLGRRDQNEFILTDCHVSRLHACVDYKRHRHVLYDVGSLNGTYINGTRVTESVLRDGDEINLGQTLLRYEVL